MSMRNAVLATLLVSMVFLGALSAALFSRADEDFDPTRQDGKKNAIGKKLPGNDTPGLHNVLVLPNQIYSGSEPHGEEGFRTLARLGVKVIVSVDGAKPNLELAKKYGIRYVHVPIGYAGVSKEAGLSLARLVRDLDGPFYIHCHHGVHRGPAGAATACIASGKVAPADAVKILELAGTSSDYAGLWRDVKNFTPPKQAEKLPELVEVAKFESLAAAMATIDRHFDNLKLCQAAGWKTPRDHPDLAPPQEALLLREGLHESGRHLAGKFDARFRQWLGESESLSRQLENALRQNKTADAARHFKALAQSCKQCHAKYRN
jgi:hypothetical protein